MSQSLHADVIDLLMTTEIDYKRTVIELAKRHPAIFVKLVSTSKAGVEPWMADVRECMLVGAKVEAIKTIREKTGMGLKEAKDISDNVQNLMCANVRANLAFYEGAATLTDADRKLANAIVNATV
jgi:ribosomal protein L7/L12